MPDAIRATAGQRDLIERATDVLSRDDRVLAVWLVGSFGRGTQDAYSDVDLWVVVDDDSVADFGHDWPAMSREIADIVLQRQVGGGDRAVFSQVTEDWRRFDVTVGTAADLAGRSASEVLALYDPSGLGLSLGDPLPPRRPDPERVRTITEEFLRVLGLSPVVLGREEYVVGVQGSGLLLSLLIDLMLEHSAVEDRGGALTLNRLLPSDLQQTLLDLPPLEATHQSVIDHHLACAAVFLPLARELHTRSHLDWPQQLEDALRHHLTTTLSLELP